MGKISTAASSFIRDAFGREIVGKQANSASLSLEPANSTYGILGVSAYGDVKDAMMMDDRLLHRFADYENMDEYPDISSALDIYADDCTQLDSEKQRSVWVESDDDKIVGDLDNMLRHKIKVEENVWEMTRELCKYGNNYEEIIVSEEGVVGLESIASPVMRRVEEGNSVIAFAQSYSSSLKIDAESLKGLQLDGGAAINDGKDVAIFEPWKIVHMRLRSKNRNSPYGYPIIESARWVWKRLILLEDSVMVFKLTRSPSRYAFYVDIGNLPPQQAERKLEELKAKVKKRKFVNPQTGKLDFRYNPLSFDEDFFLGVRDGKESTRIDVLNGPAYQQIEDVQYFLYKLYAALKVPRAYLGYDENMPSKATLCLAGDTKIPLLDGTCPTIEDLSKRSESFWVYSIDSNGNIVPGLARNARLTKSNAKTVSVTLDSGEIFRCTPDHPVMLRDGTFVEAQELTEGSSLMPLYRRLSSGKGRDQKLNGYEQIYNPSNEKWIYTHRVVTDSLFDAVSANEIRHHSDFDKLNNSPENIEIMDSKDHIQRHRDHAEKTLLREDVKQKRLEKHSVWLKTESAKQSIAKASAASKKIGSKFWEWVHSDKHRQLKSEQMIRQWEGSDSKMRISHGEAFKSKMSLLLKQQYSSGLRAAMTLENSPTCRFDANIEHLIEIAQSYRCTSKKQLIKWSGYSESLINRVLSQEGITYREFCDKYMEPSKFRDGAYLSGGKSLKNHKVVSVVFNEEVSDTYDLTVDGYHNFAIEQGVFVHNSQEDVRFARTVLRVQREVRNGLRKICDVHLAARRIDPVTVDYDLKMTVPSSIFELGQMEIRNARAALATSMERHVSLYWMLKNIYNISDKEILQIFKQKEDEAKKAQELGTESFVRKAPAITERELMSGNREDEKRIEDIVKRGMEQGNNPLFHKLSETQHFIREIANSVQSQRRR